MSRRPGLDRARLADVAVAIADADGLEAVTIARVAAELGVKGPSLYNHVASRDALVREVTLRAMTEVADALALAAAGRVGREALVATARAYRAYAEAHPGRYAACLRAPSTDDEALDLVAQRTIDVFHAALRGFDLDERELVHTVRALRSALHGFVALEAAGGFALAVDRDASFDVMVALLAAGIEERSALDG